MCVTGLVATQKIIGAEQLYFDSRASWAASLEPHVYEPASDDPLHPWAAGRFGAGANMAFRIDAARALGGFDEYLGPGTKAKGGEDIDLFVSHVAVRREPDVRARRSRVAHPPLHTGGPGTADVRLRGRLDGVPAEARPAPCGGAGDGAPASAGGPAHLGGDASRRPAGGVAVSSARRYRRIELTGMALACPHHLRSRLAGHSGRRSAP